MPSLSRPTGKVAAPEEVDDATASALQHRREHCPTAQVGAPHIDLQHLPPRISRQVPGESTSPGDPCIVDEQVWRPVLDCDPAERILDGGRVSHVQYEGVGTRFLRQLLEVG